MKTRKCYETHTQCVDTCVAATPAQAPQTKREKLANSITGAGREAILATDTPAQTSHSPLPWQALDWMILCDKVNKYGNFYVAEVSPQFRDACNDIRALAEANANLAFIVRACNEYEHVKQCLKVEQQDHQRCAFKLVTACNEYEELLKSNRALRNHLASADRAFADAKAHAQRLADACKALLVSEELSHDDYVKQFGFSQPHATANAIEALAQWEGSK